MPYRTDERLSLEESTRLCHERRVVLHRQWRAEHKEKVAGLVAADRVQWSTLDWDTIQSVITEATRQGKPGVVTRANRHLARRRQQRRARYR